MNILTTILADVATTPIVEVAEESAKEFDLLALTMKGGIIMIPLLLLSILAIYVFIERWSAIRKAAKADNTFMARIKDYIYEGDIASARNLCKKTDTPYARLIEKGISRLGRPMNDVLVAIENTGNIEIAKLEKNFPWLATTAAGAPMIGFLGTVSGMVRAFFNMAEAGGSADITTLSAGIYEALVTTVAGLSISIPSLIFHNYFVSKVNRCIVEMEAHVTSMMLKLSGRII